MKRADLIRSCINDMAYGVPYSTIGLLDYLIIDCSIPRKRVCDIAERYFGIPKEQALNIVGLYRPEYIYE